MTDPIRIISLGAQLPITHYLRSPVTALRILSTSRLHEGVVSAILDGEVVWVEVPPGFASWSTPVPGDALLITPDGEVTHRPADLFAAESAPVLCPGSVGDGALRMPPRMPRLPS